MVLQTVGFNLRLRDLKERSIEQGVAFCFEYLDLSRHQNKGEYEQHLKKIALCTRGKNYITYLLYRVID